MTLHEGLENVEAALNEGLGQNVVNQGVVKGVAKTIKDKVNQSAAKKAGKDGPMKFQDVQNAINAAGKNPTPDAIATACMGILNSCMSGKFNWGDIDQNLAKDAAQDNSENKQPPQGNAEQVSQVNESLNKVSEGVGTAVAGAVGAAAIGAGAAIGKGISNALKKKYIDARNKLLATAYFQGDQNALQGAAEKILAFLSTNKDAFTQTGLKLGNFSQALQNAAKGQFAENSPANQNVQQMIQTLQQQGYQVTPPNQNQ